MGARKTSLGQVFVDAVMAQAAKVQITPENITALLKFALSRRLPNADWERVAETLTRIMQDFRNRG